MQNAGGCDWSDAFEPSDTIIVDTGEGEDGMTAVTGTDAVAGLHNKEGAQEPRDADPVLSFAVDPSLTRRHNAVESDIPGSKDVFVSQSLLLPPQDTASKPIVVAPNDIAPSTASELNTPGRQQPYKSNLRVILNDHDTHIKYGRAYVDADYWVPNDEKQHNQLDMAHHLYLLMLGGQLYLAPIGKNPRKVLDIGTGTGIWAMDCATRHPFAQVVGYDLSPVHQVRPLSNVRFEVKDMCKPDWGYEQSSFDFIHARGVNGCVPEWPAFYGQIFE
jgi:Methyltransferase domain